MNKFSISLYKDSYTLLYMADYIPFLLKVAETSECNLCFRVYDAPIIPPQIEKLNGNSKVGIRDYVKMVHIYGTAHEGTPHQHNLDSYISLKHFENYALNFNVKDFVERVI